MGAAQRPCERAAGSGARRHRAGQSRTGAEEVRPLALSGKAASPTPPRLRGPAAQRRGPRSWRSGCRELRRCRTDRRLGWRPLAGAVHRTADEGDGDVGFTPDRGEVRARSAMPPLRSGIRAPLAMELVETCTRSPPASGHLTLRHEIGAQDGSRILPAEAFTLGAHRGPRREPPLVPRSSRPACSTSSGSRPLERTRAVRRPSRGRGRSRAVERSQFAGGYTWSNVQSATSLPCAIPSTLSKFQWMPR